MMFEVILDKSSCLFVYFYELNRLCSIVKLIKSLKNTTFSQIFGVLWIHVKQKVFFPLGMWPSHKIKRFF